MASPDTYLISVAWEGTDRLMGIHRSKDKNKEFKHKGDAKNGTFY